MRVNYSNINFNTDEYKTSLHKSEIASKSITNEILAKNPNYGIFDYEDSYKQLQALKPIIDHINNSYTDLIIISMGGATLNPQSLVQLAEKTLDQNNGIKLHFLDNTDPIYYAQLISKVNLKTTAVIAISNSGETIETISLTSAMIASFKMAGIASIKNHFYFITKQGSSSLSLLAKEIGGKIISHKENISGRFSGFTNVSTLVATIAGVNAGEYIEGMQNTLDDFIKNPEASKATIYAAVIMLLNKPIMINLAYLQQFSSFLDWYNQIIAESLGKKEKGITPVKSLGPNDQHSMLQLYLSERNDKFYNLFYVDNLPQNIKLDSNISTKSLQHFSLSEVNDINFAATKQTLEDQDKKLRSIILNDTSARSIGQLTSNMMMETIILAKIMDINPFDQPNVELIKNNIRLKLLDSSSEKL
ncbi:MAG TPA: hypothetical protein QKA08_00750 [Candidatus Megaira endosymbiont of Nemacystus decipiens]|nr:hypothetical protein [Candidatus Megaera endosymbiont of Nemacystus decipiens]